MVISHRIENDACIVALRGNINVYEIPDAKIYIGPFVDDHSIKKVIFNLEAVDFIDSSGIGFFIGIFKELKQREAFIGLTNLSQKNRDAFEMANIHRILNLYDTVEAALADLQ